MAGNDDEDRSSWRMAARQLAIYAHVGLMFPVAIAIGFLAGYLIDRWLGTVPWVAVAGMALGVVAAIRNLLQAVARDTDSR